MKVSELKDILNNIVRYTVEDAEVVVRVVMPYSTIGPVPTRAVKQVYDGFDWDIGKFIIHTYDDLTTANSDFKAQFTKLQDEYGKVCYEKKKLERENKKLSLEIKELQTELNRKS